MWTFHVICVSLTKDLSETTTDHKVCENYQTIHSVLKSSKVIEM